MSTWSVFNWPGLGAKIVLTCVWLVFNAGSARPEGVEFKPLDLVLAQEQSVNIRYYALKRCVAAYGNLQLIFHEVPGLEEQNERIERAQTMFLSYILKEFAPENGISTTPDAVFESIGTILDLYMENSKENYAATGNMVSDFLQADVRICNEFLESL